jgi:CRP/FNR family transcriptional regulator, cyclic AMP receptor protein
MIGSTKSTRKRNPFDSKAFLVAAGVPRNMSRFRISQVIFSQGDLADSVLYIRKGSVQFSVSNSSGREAVVARFGPRDFFGEGCLAGQATRLGTARALAPTTILTIDKNEMLRVLHEKHELSEQFIWHMIARKIRIEEQLVAQLCDSAEQLLARTLLKLAGYGKHLRPSSAPLNVSQGTLAKMIGTTRPRVNFFMNKFRELGYLSYGRKIYVKKSLLEVVVQDGAGGAY